MVKSQNILKNLHIIDQLIIENCFCWYLSFLFSIFFSHTKTKQKKNTVVKNHTIFIFITYLSLKKKEGEK